MSVATRPADRLPRASGPGNRGREIRLGILGVLGIVVLVVGVPAALVVFVGYPLPRHAPTSEWLTQTITATLIVKILACVLWLVWAHFVVCLLAEWRALRRGRLPGNVAFGGGSQALARRLVAAALLLSGAATAAFPHSGGGSSGPVRPAVAHHVVTTPAAPSTAGTAADRLQDEAAAGTKYYVVEPPHGRHYDCLWDIAERTLGDPLRYKEIFALNKDRIQADGSKLVDANLIRPGWELRLPADAHGAGVHTTHARGPNAPVPDAGTDANDQTATQAGTGGGIGGVLGTLGATHAATSRPGATAISSAPAASGGLDTRLFGGGLILAGILAALSARRGPFAAASEEEDALAGVADTALAAGLDRALRNLAAGRLAQGRALPQPIVAWASGTEVSLTMAAGDIADPPPSWTASGDGRTWNARLLDLADADVAAPYPGLVPVGREHGYELFVDLEQAPGLIALAGEAEPARELATAVAVQVVTSAWSDGARVTLVGFGNAAEIAAVAPSSIDHAAQLSAVLEQIEDEHERVAQLRRQLGVDGVLTGRQARRSQAWRPHVVILSGPPTPDEARRLQAVVGDGRSQFVAITVGDTAGARWRFALDRDGRIDLGVLGVAADAHHLGSAGVARIAELAAAAGQQRREQSAAVQTMTPHGALAAASALPVRPLAPSPRATVTLLGPVSVVAEGPVLDAKRDLLTELVVAVALHPEGLHEGVLRMSLWPRGVSDEVFGSAVADAASWLGHDSAGQPALRESNGRWYLGDTVHIDWEQFRRLAESAGGPNEPARLTQALGLIQGEAFSATPAGQYAWLAFARGAREARVVGTAVARRAAELHVAAGREDAAEQALRRGLLLVPSAEVLWRDLLTLVGRRGPDPAAAVAAQLYDTLTRLRVWPEPETDALVAQVAPGYHRSDPDPAAPAAIAG